MTIIELTEAEAQLFLVFRKYQPTFMTLLEHGVFDVKSGQATISFKPTGEIGTVVIQKLVYRG